MRRGPSPHARSAPPRPASPSTLQQREQATRRLYRRPRGYRPTATLRAELEGALERALALLDMIDGDPDQEEEPDREPEETDQNLGAHESLEGTVFSGGCDELEPSLGATHSHHEQRLWGANHTDQQAHRATWDFEDQCEDEGFDSDREPEAGH